MRVPVVEVTPSGGVGQGHRGDGAVAVQDLAGQPGHFPAVPFGCAPGGMGGVVVLNGFSPDHVQIFWRMLMEITGDSRDPGSCL
jgi:hypothetical protein